MLKAVKDPRIQLIIWAGKKVVYEPLKKEWVRDVRRQQREREVLDVQRRQALQIARVREHRLNTGRPGQRAHWREYYGRIDRLIEINRSAG